MSKESFLEQLTLDIRRRFGYIDNYYSDGLFTMTDTFRVALAIAYMALSKDSIIDKDKDNPDKLGRLTRKVDQKELLILFSGPDCPTIDFSKTESGVDEAWILDCIRDSILHEQFDIDTDNRIIHINNTMENRHLVADIPFDWFFKYIESEIYERRFTDKYTMRGFYYNKYMHDVREHPSIKGKKIKGNFAIANHIIYSINIYGEKIPIEQIRDEIEELLDYYGREYVVTDEDRLKYGSKLSSDSLYNSDYFISFLKARDDIRDTICQEYPNCKIYINIYKHKRKYYDRFRRHFFNTYSDYDDLFNKMNSMFRRSDDSTLKIISRLFEEQFNPSLGNEDMFIRLVTGKLPDKDREKVSLYEDMDHSRVILKNVLFQVYGLAMLAMNKSLFNNSLALDSIENNTLGYSKNALRTFIDKRRTLIHTIVKDELYRVRLEEQVLHCPPNIKPTLESNLERVRREITINLDEYKRLTNNTEIIPNNKYVRDTKLRSINELDELFNKYFDSFLKCSPTSMSHGTSTKKFLKEVVYDLFEKYSDLQLKYLLARADSSETLDIIRNCFSHLGRVKVTDYFLLDRAYVYLTDYDENGDISGLVRTNYLSLIDLLHKGIPANTNNSTDVKVR